jgi:hypothetical protein
MTPTTKLVPPVPLPPGKGWRAVDRQLFQFRRRWPSLRSGGGSNSVRRREGLKIPKSVGTGKRARAFALAVPLVLLIAFALAAHAS